MRTSADLQAAEGCAPDGTCCRPASCAGPARGVGGWPTTPDHRAAGSTARAAA
jgi:hypothetical protein